MDKSLNKYISDTGFCSRREADKLIETGRVTINGVVAVKGNRATETDLVELDGILINKKVKRVYLAFNKPPGITCTTDLKDKTNIISFINYKDRIFPIGRLDKPSEGLIFLTNDGDIVNKILRAGNNHEKEYIVTVDRPLASDFAYKMSNGVKILNTITKNCVVKTEGKSRFRIILTQGLNRQIRRMCEALDYRVITLKRIRIMHISIDHIPIGKWRYLTPDEIQIMELMVQNSTKTLEASIESWNE